MSFELSSAKYLPPELIQDHGIANPNEIPVAAEADAPTWSPGTPPTSPLEGGTAARKSAPILVSVIAVLLGLFGIVGVFGGVFGALGQAALTNSDSLQNAVMSRAQGSEAEIYFRTIQKCQQFSTVIYLHNAICTLVGIGFLASCFVLLTGRNEANSFASTACMAAIFYNCLTLVVTWITLPSFEGIKGMPEGAASLAFTFAIVAAGIGAFIKVGFYLVTIVYLSKASVKAAFAPATPVAPVPEAVVA